MTSATIPAELTKNKREHTLPLTQLTLEVLKHVEVDTKRNDTLFFPARGKPDQPFNGWSKGNAQLDGLTGTNG